jgi:hypothetical protein
VEGKKVGAIGGIQCANFGWVRKFNVGPCKGASHGACCKQHLRDVFPVLAIVDLDELLLDEKLLEDNAPLWLREVREGDHLLCLTQCDKCHFINMKGWR